MHRNLRSFLDLLRHEKDVVTIDTEVDPYLELAEIHRRVIELGGPALRFNRVKGSRFPVVTNLFGTAKRIELAFGRKPEEFIKQLVGVAESLLPPNRSELWKHRQLVRDFLKLGTRNVTRAPVTEVVQKQVQFGELPVLTTWQEDGGPFIRCRSSTPRIRPRRSTTSAFIACKSMMPTPPDCIGRFRRAAAFIITRPNK